MTPLLILLTGCTTILRFPPPQEWDTGDTAEEFDPVKVTSVSVSCDPNTDTWLWQAETDGWTRAVVLDVVDTSVDLGWEEEHDMVVVDSHPGGRWDRLALGPIPGGVDPAEWTPNTATAFDCSTDRSKLTFAIRVWNHPGDLTDCIVWGNDADEVVTRLSNDQEVSAFGQCLVLTTTNGSDP